MCVFHTQVCQVNRGDHLHQVHINVLPVRHRSHGPTYLFGIIEKAHGGGLFEVAIMLSPSEESVAQRILRSFDADVPSIQQSLLVNEHQSSSMHILTHTELIQIGENSKAAWGTFRKIITSGAADKTLMARLTQLDNAYGLFNIVLKLEREQPSISSNDQKLYRTVHDFTEDVDKSILFTLESLTAMSQGQDATMAQSMATQAISQASQLYSAVP